MFRLAVRGLIGCVDAGGVRVGRFRGTICSAVGKCWVNLREEEDGKKCRVEDLAGTEELERLMRRLLVLLGEKDPVAAKVSRR